MMMLMVMLPVVMMTAVIELVLAASPRQRISGSKTRCQRATATDVAAAA